MKNSLLLLLLPLFFGCLEEAEDLPENIFDDENLQIFEFVDHSVTLGGGNLFEVTIEFASIYPDLIEEQQERITGIRVVRNGGIQPSLPPDATTISTTTVFTVCYQLAFETESGDTSQFSEEYCVTP